MKSLRVFATEITEHRRINFSVTSVSSVAKKGSLCVLCGRKGFVLWLNYPGNPGMK